MIYFLQDSLTCDIKIGFAGSSAEARQKALQTGNPRVLVLIGTISGDMDREDELHERFKASRGIGEWFRPTPDLLLFIIEQAGYQGRREGEVAAEKTISLRIAEAISEECDGCIYPGVVKEANARRAEAEIDEWFASQPLMCGPAGVQP